MNLTFTHTRHRIILAVALFFPCLSSEAWAWGGPDGGGSLPSLLLTGTSGAGSLPTPTVPVPPQGSSSTALGPTLASHPPLRFLARKGGCDGGGCPPSLADSDPGGSGGTSGPAATAAAAGSSSACRSSAQFSSYIVVLVPNPVPTAGQAVIVTDASGALVSVEITDVNGTVLLQPPAMPGLELSLPSAGVWRVPLVPDYGLILVLA